MSRLIVVGGGAAGMTCASVAKRRDPDLDVLVLEQGDHVSFSACGMPYWLGGLVPGDADQLVVRTPEEAAERGVEVRTGTHAVDVDPDGRTVTIREGESESDVSYDTLCLAPGVEAIDPFDRSGLEGVFTLRHLDDGIRLRHHLEQADPDQGVVIGGGFVGVEMAEAFIERGMDTTLVHSDDTLLSALVEPELGELVNERVQEAGVECILGSRATGIQGAEHLEAVEVGNREVPADVVVLAVGARPRTRVAEAAGCTLGETGAIQVDDAMRTSVDGVLACGDCIEYEHRLTGQATQAPLALHANRAGRVAGETVAGNEASFPGVLGTAVTRFLEQEIAATGLTLPEAREAGFDAVARTITSVTQAGYMPASREVHARLVVEEGTGRVLGGQLVGGPGTGKRIDTVAAALWMEATAGDVEAMDLAYAPPVSPTWDPVAIAARLAGREAGTSP